jgi:hypothetical protein
VAPPLSTSPTLIASRVTAVGAGHAFAGCVPVSTIPNLAETNFLKDNIQEYRVRMTSVYR